MSKQMLELAEELREYTAMKYAGDCKCGKCQLVPRRLVERIYHALNSTAIRSSADSGETEIAFVNLCEALGLQASAHAYLDAGAARRAVAAPSASVREALEPFANLVAFFNEKHRDTRPIIYGLDTVIAQRLTVGDLRRAATALAALSAPVPDRDADLPSANDVRGILGSAKMTILTNPEDTWGAYCAEVAEQDQSPQGAMAFAIDRLTEALNPPQSARSAREAERFERTGLHVEEARTLDESESRFPLQYEDGPDYCTVKDAQGCDFALTVQPEMMKAMERALVEDVARLMRPPQCQAVNVERDALDRIAKFATSAEMQTSVDEDCARSEFARSWHATAELADFRSGYDECINIARSVSLTRPERWEGK